MIRRCFCVGALADHTTPASIVRPAPRAAFQQLNAVGDLLDLIPALAPRQGCSLSRALVAWPRDNACPPLRSAGVHPSWDNITDAAEFMARVHATTHCSGLVKVRV